MKVCGYSDNDNLKYHSNKLTFVHDGILYYNIDTKDDQSGSPVFKEKGNPIIYRIHKGFSPIQKLNMAAIITTEMISVL